ncbi:dihydroneopterin aldolase [Geminicoccus flavidas]|uniref:dihydroneopterin aldolase n=1 Tax=Geminicoccus flavidas TaxID=2506407 RepID=UPI00135B71FA|nr:dihydroneopterin aldolase [Geminicoccus flavidas]
MQDRQTIRLKGLVLELPIGVFPEEFRRTQPVEIEVEAWRRAGTFTSGRYEDCLDYHRLYRHLTEVWPARPHQALLESWAEDLVRFVFEDPQVEGCRVRLAKPAVYGGRAVPEVEFVRVRG